MMMMNSAQRVYCVEVSAFDADAREVNKNNDDSFLFLICVCLFVVGSFDVDVVRYRCRSEIL